MQILWKNKLLQGVWLLVGVGAIILLVAAMHQKKHKACGDVKIEIGGVEEHLFIDEKDVMDIINHNGKINGKPIAEVDLRSMEESLEKNAWVKNAEMFFDNNQVLQVSIVERQPVARVFTVQGNSFYLDSTGLRLPLSEKLSARVPVVTNFPSDKKVMASSDSELLKGVVAVSKYVMTDSFWMAQVSQIDITPQGSFELVPTLGDQIVAIGNAEDLDAKFKRLYTFYKNIWIQYGINTYEKIDVQFNSQVVAVRRGASKAWADSAKAKALLAQLMQHPIIPNDSLKIPLTNAMVGKTIKITDSLKSNKPLPKALPKNNLKKKVPVKGKLNTKATKITLSNVKGFKPNEAATKKRMPELKKPKHTEAKPV